MGDVKGWGDAFARWYYAQGKGTQFALCLGLVSMVVLGLALIFPVQESHEDVEVWCTPDGSFKVFLSPDDPRLKFEGVAGELGIGLCDLTM